MYQLGMYASFPSPGQWVYLHWRNEPKVLVQAMRLVHYIKEEKCYGALLVRKAKPAPGMSRYTYLPTASLTYEHPYFTFSSVEEKDVPKEFLESKKGTHPARPASEPETWEEQLQTTLDEHVDGWDEAEEDAEMCKDLLRRTNDKIYERFLLNAVIRSAQEAHLQNKCKGTHEARLVTEAASAFLRNEQRAQSHNDRGSEESKRRQRSILRDLYAKEKTMRGRVA